MNNQPNGRPKWVAYWPVIVGVLTFTYHAGHLQFNQTVQAEELKTLQNKCSQMEEAIHKIPVIEERMTSMARKQNEMQVEQTVIRREQLLVIKTLSRIEAKI